MEPRDFHYELPPELIAQAPLAERSGSRLLVLPREGGPHDLLFTALPELLAPGDLLVVNDTRVMPARLYGNKATGGRVELLLERLESPTCALVQLRASHPPGVGTGLDFPAGLRARVLGREQEFFRLEFSAPLEPVLAGHGHVPLPPYIRRSDEPADRDRYQTVFARARGAVAAPTAGLHFDERLLAALADRGIRIAALTLHVGAGTFAPLRPAQLAAGRLHRERLEVSAGLCAAVAECRARAGRVVAVGTTVMRGLETAAAGGELRPWTGETDLFIRPGHSFRVADALVTNFHLPESSLLMLVCAFGGTERVLAAYRHAVAARYRFFSYGDAMYLERARP